MSTIERRRVRKREILNATRALFDERGVNNSQIEDIAKAAGINRAIVYRHFVSKDEIFALTMASYLIELRAALTGAAGSEGTATERYLAITDAFGVYAMDHPAFIDCAQVLTGQAWSQLRGEVPAGALLKLGQLMADCLAVVSDVLEAGLEAGEFDITDPPLVANMLYAAGLGVLQQARIGIYITYDHDGAPIVRQLGREQVRTYLRKAALAATQ